MSEMIDSMAEYALARLDAWAGARELKVTHLLLARGRMVSQPMPTLPDRTGHERLVPRLRAAGFDPVRVRVETVPWTMDSPGPGGGYFEHHLKLLLPAGYEIRSQEREFVLYDSGPSVDDGWIDD
ncbi:hypothetical protein ACFYNM_31165 [Streptomyces spororaveus]|uniref:hypothetical protein n=1 Tax=Streptomyces spororaveus TaxID=284039 RepID=UPI0036B40D9A